MNGLLLDLGNSSLKAGCLADGELTFLGAGSPDIDPATLLRCPARRAWLASVAGVEKTRALHDRLVTAGLEVTIVTVRDHASCLRSRYASDQLGVDRWLALLACLDQGLYPAVVVDAGSATTIDMLDSEGVHLGGYILPGPDQMEDALLRGTAIRLKGPRAQCKDALPVTTGEAIHCGITLAQVAAIRAVCDRAAPGSRLVLGGGGAHLLSKQLAIPHEMAGQLVLQGLAVLAKGEVSCGG